jgi:HK97 family phage prohead protease
MERERKLLRLEIKAFDDATGTIEGYGSVKHAIDSYGDRIADGAYGDLSGFVRKGFLAEGHDWDSAPIGYILDAREDEHGLFFKAQFHSTPEAQKVRTVVMERMAAGKDVGLSIGFFTKDAEYTSVNGKQIRILKDIDIREISVVAVPAMDLALAAAVKGGGLPYAEQEEGVLAALTDWVSRLQQFAGERKQGLTETKLAALTQAKSLIEALLQSPEPEPQEPVFASQDEVDEVLAIYHRWS